jgi:hypothetical protein
VAPALVLVVVACAARNGATAVQPMSTVEQVVSLGSGRVALLRSAVVQALAPAQPACVARNGATAAQPASIAERVASLDSGRVPLLRSAVVQALAPAQLACVARNGATAAQPVSFAERVASLDLVHVTTLDRFHPLTIAVDRAAPETTLVQDRHMVNVARSGVGAARRSIIAVQGARKPLAHATEPFATLPMAISL